jgi:lysophospholipase L1-like esterase
VSNAIPTARIAALGALIVTLASVGGRADAAGSQRAVLDVGDSLSVGAAPFLAQQLRGYRIDGYRRVGLRSDEAALRVARARSPLPRVVVVSAGTNDDPHEVAVFSRSVAEVLATVGGARCVVWPSIVRPPVLGLTYARLNRTLARAAARHPNLVVVDWVGMVRRHPVWLRGDGVHASSAGYRARAEAIARAVRNRCFA